MGFFGSPIFLMLLFLPFIFMMWRRSKKENEARQKMKKGDKVVAGALVGEIVDVDDRFAKVKIAPGVTVQALANGLQPLEDPSKTAQTTKDTAKPAKKEEAASKS